MNNTTKALITAIIFLLLVIALVIALHKSAREYAPAVDAAILSEFSSGIDKIVADTLSRPYEPSTGLVEETSSEETTTVRETTTAEPTTERKTIAQTTTTEVYEEDYYDYHGGYIGTFELTAYEWTGERMANGEYPYYGACASNYFALGTVPLMLLFASLGSLLPRGWTKFLRKLGAVLITSMGLKMLIGGLLLLRG